MSEEQVDNAAATTATDDNAVPSTEEEGLQTTEGQEEGQPTPAAEEDPQETRSNTQKRFDELTAKNRNLESRVLAAEQSQRRAPIVFDATEPKPEDFEDGAEDLNYVVAKAAHDGAKSAIDSVNQSHVLDRQTQVSQALRTKFDGYVKKAAVVKKDNPDFETVIDGSRFISKDLQGNLTAAAMAILEVPNGPEVAYHLGLNDDVALSLNSSNPTQAALTIARISSQLTVIPASKNKAPPPVGSEGGEGLAPADDGLVHIKGAKFT